MNMATKFGIVRSVDIRKCRKVMFSGILRENT